MQARRSIARVVPARTCCVKRVAATRGQSKPAVHLTSLSVYRWRQLPLCALARGAISSCAGGIGLQHRLCALTTVCTACVRCVHRDMQRAAFGICSTVRAPFQAAAAAGGKETFQPEKPTLFDASLSPFGAPSDVSICACDATEQSSFTKQCFYCRPVQCGIQPQELLHSAGLCAAEVTRTSAACSAAPQRSNTPAPAPHALASAS